MMVLVGYTVADVLIWTLWISLIILILIIGYRWLLRYLQRDRIKPENYCELYSLEVNPVAGEVSFYFTTETVRSYRLIILDTDMNDLLEIVNQDCNIGGNIIRFDSTKLSNGDYFYCLKTDNQKVMKKMSVNN